jgi:hypothetical protein
MDYCLVVGRYSKFAYRSKKRGYAGHEDVLMHALHYYKTFTKKLVIFGAIDVDQLLTDSAYPIPGFTSFMLGSFHRSEFYFSTDNVKFFWKNSVENLITSTLFFYAYSQIRNEIGYHGLRPLSEYVVWSTPFFRRGRRLKQVCKMFFKFGFPNLFMLRPKYGRDPLASIPQRIDVMEMFQRVFHIYGYEDDNVSLEGSTPQEMISGYDLRDLLSDEILQRFTIYGFVVSSDERSKYYKLTRRGYEYAFDLPSTVPTFERKDYVNGSTKLQLKVKDSKIVHADGTPFVPGFGCAPIPLRSKVVNCNFGDPQKCLCSRCSSWRFNYDCFIRGVVPMDPEYCLPYTNDSPSYGLLCYIDHLVSLNGIAMFKDFEVCESLFSNAIVSDF